MLRRRTVSSSIVLEYDGHIEIVEDKMVVVAVLLKHDVVYAYITM